MLFSLAWNIIFSENLKVLCFEIFGDEGYGIFEPKDDGNMIVTDDLKVPVLNFLVMRNTVFF